MGGCAAMLARDRHRHALQPTGNRARVRARAHVFPSLLACLRRRRAVEASGRVTGRSRARARGLSPAVLACDRLAFAMPCLSGRSPSWYARQSMGSGRNARARAHVFPSLLACHLPGGGEPGAPAPGPVDFAQLCLHASDGDTEACFESSAPGLSACPGPCPARVSAGGSVLVSLWPLHKCAYRTICLLLWASGSVTAVTERQRPQFESFKFCKACQRLRPRRGAR